MSPVHFAERHALVLGEAVVALGGKAVASELHLFGIAGLLGGFALVATLWWSYFAWNVEAGERWLRGHGRPFAPGDVGAALAAVGGAGGRRGVTASAGRGGTRPRFRRGGG